MTKANKVAAAKAIKNIAVYYQLMCESLDGRANTDYKIWKEEVKKNIQELSKMGINVDLTA